MIVDCHAHVFEHWIGACGHPNSRQHKLYLQRMLTRTIARTYRTRDGRRADTKALFRENDNSWNGLNDVDFRVGRFGQLEFTVDGEDYHIQYMPVGMQELRAPPELMLAQMAYAGVDHCILQAGSGYGRMNDYNAYAQRQYPHKMTGLMHVDEAKAGEPAWLAEIDRAYSDLGLRGIYYNLEGLSRYGFAWPIDDPRLRPFWEKLRALKLKFCIELNSGPTYDQAGYMGHLTALGRLMNDFPDVPVHIAMGPPVGFFARGGKWEFPREALAIYKRDNVVIELMFPITWGGQWDYPYPEAQALIRDLRDKLGAEKLLWGSDMPNVERFCTYTQCVDYVRRYCEFLTAREKDLILGVNCARFYGLKLE